MSLALEQHLRQARSDRDDALHRLAVGEDTRYVRNLLNQANSDIQRIEKQMADEKAQALAKKQTDGPRPNPWFSDKEKRKPRDLPADLDLSCLECSSIFVFSGKDQVFYQKNGYNAPSRCLDCRKMKKNEKPSGSTLKCCDCEKDFFFSDAKASIFEDKGYEAPKRCRECTEAHKSLAPITISCRGCSMEFSFSVKSQKEFKEKKWPHPKDCRDCKNKKKAARSSGPIAAGAGSSSTNI